MHTLKGIYNPLCVPQFDLVQISEDTIRTRGKLIQHDCYYDLRKFNFTNRVIPVWNMWFLLILLIHFKTV